MKLQILNLNINFNLHISLNMIRLHFHCQNCARDEELFNITCIEEIKEHIDSNLYTRISYCTICNNCKELSKELKKIKELDIENHYMIWDGCMIIYNLKLIEQHGFFSVNIFEDNTIVYYSYDTTIKNWTKIDKKIFSDSVKDESLIGMRSLELYNGIPDYHNLVLEPIKDKGYEVNFIQKIVSCHYYIVKKPTLTKPARKL